MFNICVAGIFHYKYYVRYLSKYEYFSKIYFSHKLNTLNELGIHKYNFFLKEYLLQAHIKIFGAKSAFKMITLYNFLWDFWVSRLFKPQALNLVLLQGNNIGVLKAIRKKGFLTLGEAVNLHPKEMLKVMNKDTETHGVQFFWSKTVFKKKIKEIELVDYLLVPSKVVADSYIRNGFNEQHIFTVPYGSNLKKQHVETTDKSTKDRLKHDRSKLKILIVAQVFPRKGQFHFLQAIKEFKRESEVEITMVGLCDSDYMKSLESIGVSFHYFAGLPHEVVLEKMSNSDVVVLSSIEDGFGMVVSEALSVGTPVIVSKYAGASELVQQCGGGIVYDPFDYATLNSAIDKISNGNFEVVHTSWPTWEEYSKRVVDISNMLLNKNDEL